MTRATRTGSLALFAALALSACAGDGPGSPGADAGPGAGDAGPGAAGLVPANGQDLFPYLADRRYDSFAAQSAPRPSAGPHGGVRTFINPILEQSLAAGAPVHPRGAAAVKELYGSGGDLRGWAVSVKVADDSAGGAGWYWYEVFSTTSGDSPVVDGTGASLCTGCHAGGVDFVTIPYPLD